MQALQYWRCVVTEHGEIIGYGVAQVAEGQSRKKADHSVDLLRLVAGAGLEPTTFGL
jgi:hypothetical protein